MIEPPLSARTRHLREASLLRTLTEKVSVFADGINLGQGVCDLDMPEELRRATIASINEILSPRSRRDITSKGPTPRGGRLRQEFTPI